MNEKNRKNMMEDLFKILLDWMHFNSFNLGEPDLKRSSPQDVQGFLNNMLESFFYAKGEMITPDGERVVTEWGAPPPSLKNQKHKNNDTLSVLEQQEIFHDILEEKDRFKILIDMRGQNLDNIEITATEETIEIHHRQEKIEEIPLPTSIEPNIKKKEIHNGIISIEVKKKKD